MEEKDAWEARNRDAPQEWERHLFASVWLLVCFLLMGDIFEHSLCVCVCRASSMITVTSAAQ